MKKIEKYTSGREKKKRVEEIDILKALAIICIVAGHSGAPFTHFIYLFHVAVFFIASGFFFKNISSEDFRALFRGIRKKFKQLWLPFFVWNMVFVFLHNFFIEINVYTDNPEIMNYVSGRFIGTTDRYNLSQMITNTAKGAIFCSEEKLLGACWFLKILFFVSIGYLIVDYIIKKIFKKHILIIQGIISVVLLLLGFLCSIKRLDLFGLPLVASFYCLYYIGHVFAVYKDKYISWNSFIYGIGLVISFFLLIGLNRIGNIELGDNSYENPLFLIVASFSGWCFLFCLAHFISMIPIQALKRCMTTIGKRTLSVVVFHFLAMKTVSLIIIGSFKLPAFCISAFPNLYGEKNVWWLAYIVAGIGLPVLMNILYHVIFDNTVKVLKSKIKMQRC